MTRIWSSQARARRRHGTNAVRQSGWLAAVLVRQRISNGLFRFTPDASRDGGSPHRAGIKKRHCQEKQDRQIIRPSAPPPAHCVNKILLRCFFPFGWRPWRNRFICPPPTRLLFETGRGAEILCPDTRQVVDQRVLRLRAFRRLANARGPGHQMPATGPSRRTDRPGHGHG